MEHYICKGGCEGVSEQQGVCQEPTCPNFGKALEKCDCIDNKHEGAFVQKDADSQTGQGTEN